MRKDIAMAWAKALPKYKQTQQRLRRELDDGSTGFCCMGVLCNLHAQAHPEFAATQTSPTTYDGFSSFPSERVLQWAGLNSENGAYGMDGDSLVNDNDRRLHNFEQIADTIEKHWREL